jgi:hypothetical protein
MFKSTVGHRQPSVTNTAVYIETNNNAFVRAARHCEAL